MKINTPKGKGYRLNFPETTPRGTIPLRMKVNALADFYVERHPIEEVVGKVYDELRIRKPSNTYQALYEWRRQLIKLISSGSAPHDLIELCIERGLMEMEAEDEDNDDLDQ